MIFKKNLIFIAVFLWFGICAISNEPTQIKNKKYKLSICSVVKNEAKYLKEWIEFHRLIGVDHFYLYNNNSTDQIRKVLNFYIKKGIVSLIYWPDCLKRSDEECYHLWPLSTQIPAYENAIKFRALKETKWLALLTPDEFLVPVESLTMKEFLAKFDSASGILLATDIFDASKTSLSLPKSLMIESVDRVGHKTNLHKTIPPVIVKPEECDGFSWPPYQIRFKNGKKPIELTRSAIRINRYVNREGSPSGVMKHKLYADSQRLDPQELSALLEKGYVLEDQEQIISKFIPELKKTMHE